MVTCIEHMCRVTLRWRYGYDKAPAADARHITGVKILSAGSGPRRFHHRELGAALSRVAAVKSAVEKMVGIDPRALILNVCAPAILEGASTQCDVLRRENFAI
jgi:hypothetical protein